MARIKGRGLLRQDCKRLIWKVIATIAIRITVHEIFQACLRVLQAVLLEIQAAQAGSHQKLIASA
jgi:hypothetical protein